MKPIIMDETDAVRADFAETRFPTRGAEPFMTCEQLKEQGTQLALDHADDLWLKLFQSTGKELARSGAEFTSEDIVDFIGLPPNESNHNAVGAAMKSLCQLLKLTRIGFRASNRPESRARMIAIWQGVF